MALSASDREDIRQMLAAVVGPLRLEIAELKKVDRKFSGMHRALNEDVIPRFKAGVEQEQEHLSEALSIRDDRLVAVVNDVSDRQIRSEAQLKNIVDVLQLGLVKVKDDAGGVSIRPASMIAAETGLRAEGKQDALTVTVDSTEKHALQSAKWSKRSSLINAIVTALIFALYAVFKKAFGLP